MITNNYTDFTRVSVPQLFDRPYPVKTDAPPDFPLETGCRYFLSAGGYKNAAKLISNLYKGKPFIKWSCNERYESPFLEKKVAHLKNQTLSLWENFSLALLIKITALSYSIINSYCSQFDFLLPSVPPNLLPDIPLKTIPKFALINSVVSLYNNGLKATEAAKTISESKNKESAQLGYGELFSATSKIFKAFLNFVSLSIYYHGLSKVSPVVNFSLAISAYLGSIIGLVQSNDCKQKLSLRKQITHRADPSKLTLG